jgi:hypothetical protein
MGDNFFKHIEMIRKSPRISRMFMIFFYRQRKKIKKIGAIGSKKETLYFT